MGSASSKRRNTHHAFQAAFAEEQRLARQEFKFTLDEVLGHQSQATVDRGADRRATLKHDLCSLSPGRDKPLPTSQEKAGHNYVGATIAERSLCFPYDKSQSVESSA